MDYPFFTHRELACRHCSIERMDPVTMDRLIGLRQALNFPLPVTSGYRCPTHNQAVSSTGPNGPHTTGRAVDIRVHGHHAYELVKLVTLHGFTGIGLSQGGAHARRFIHLDDLPNGPGQPRPWVWDYS
jgi:uncharacterized protein YcbK (DUF882 family)